MRCNADRMPYNRAVRVAGVIALPVRGGILGPFFALSARAHSGAGARMAASQVTN